MKVLTQWDLVTKHTCFKPLMKVITINKLLQVPESLIQKSINFQFDYDNSKAKHP